MNGASVKKRNLLVAFGFAASVLSAFVCADQPPAIPRIGVVVLPAAKAPYEQGLRAGLLDLGYIEGKNIVIDWRRHAGGDEERSLAADLARSKLDVIVVFSTPAARAALIMLDARNQAELDAALRGLSRRTTDGVLVTGNTLFRANKSKVELYRGDAQPAHKHGRTNGKRSAAVCASVFMGIPLEP